MTAAPPNLNEQLVRSLFEALNRPDLEALSALYAPDAVLIFAASTDSPRRNQAPARKAALARPVSLRGPQNILKYYEWLLFDRRRGTEFEVDRVFTQPDGIVVDWHIESQDMAVLEEGREDLVIDGGRITRHNTSLSELPEHLRSLAADPAQSYGNADTPQSNAAEQAAEAADNEPAQSSPAALAAETQPVEASAPIAWPSGKCLIGMSVGPDDTELALLRSRGYAAIYVGRVEAVKLPLTALPEDVAALRRSNADLFLMVSVYRQLPASGEPPEAYVQAVAGQVGALYQAGVRYFQIEHHQGIIVFNVWQSLFGSLARLADWFVEVQSLLKAQFPEIQIGFSAIHPPYDRSWAADTERFLTEIDPAIEAADWVGVPCHWSTPEERESRDGGRLYERYRERYPGKLLFVTAFGSARAMPDPDSVAEEHLAYYQSLRHVPDLGAAFADGAPGTAGLQAWIFDSGTPGRLGNVVGARRWGEPGDPAENFAGFANNDRPDGKDELDYDDYARAFVRVLSNPDTKTPLTIGIYGAWGMGKSFLMKRIRALIVAQQTARDEARRKRPWHRRLRDNLLLLRPVRRKPPPGKSPDETGRRGLSGWLAEAFTRAPSAQVDFHCVEFNAWVYSGSENLWAGLITHLYNEVEQFLGTRRTVPFRFTQNAQRALKKAVGLLVIYGLAALLLSFLLDLQQIQAAWTSLAAAANPLGDAVALGGTLAAVVAVLVAVRPFLTALRDLVNTLSLARSEQLAALASRRDFRDKIGFMADIKAEIREVRKLLDRGRQGVGARLVVFIDDLDRCEPKKAVEVLEAIMLLLADEDGMPFIVVLGIDARIVVKAVEERYGKVLTEAGISGYEYLDKIVQIPFRIPPPPGPALAKYVTSLLWRSEAERQKAEADEQAAQARDAAPLGPRLTPSVSATAPTASPPAATTPASIDQPPTPRARDGSDLDFAPIGRIPLRALPPPEVTFLPDERQAFERYAQHEHLSPNPRRIKRILNVYRIVRLLKPDTTAAQRQQLIKWVVLSEQWPFRTAWLLQAAEDDAQRPEAARKLKDSDGLRAVYAEVVADVRAKDVQPFASLDADPDLFDNFLEALPLITVADLRRLRPLTFNLNPALQGEVIKAVGRKGSA